MYVFIINPNARSGLGFRTWTQLRAILEERNIPFEEHFTRYPGHAAELARNITSQPHSETLTLVALGGDGSINEVVNGITDFRGITFGYIPIGSGNDFARSMQIPKDPVQALEQILNPTDYAYINIGKLLLPPSAALNSPYSLSDLQESPQESAQTAKKPLPASRRYAVSAGIGFDADVCVHNNHSTFLKKFLNRLKLGKLSYTAVALDLLIHLKPGRMKLILDENEPIHLKKVYFIAAMNQRFEGGGFKFCPNSDPEDDILDIITVSGLPKWIVPLLLPTAFFGLHVYFPGVHTYTCKKAHIISDRTLPVHTDGEADLRTKELLFTLEADRLRFIRS